MTTLAPEKATGRPAGDEPEDISKDTEDDGITELEKIAPDRVDGVATPANGFPVLMLKSAADGDATKNGDSDDDEDDDEDEDESGDTDDGGSAEADAGAAAKTTDPATDPGPDPALVRSAHTAYKAACREWETAEPTTKGVLDSTDYLRAQSEWRKWNQIGKDEGLDGTRAGQEKWVAKHIADATAAEPEITLAEDLVKAESEVYKRDVSTAERKKLASEGKALPDGSYPIDSTEDLNNAAVLARSGHGNATGAKRLIARRAQELGVANPLDSKGDDGGKASKDTQAPVAPPTGETAETLDPETAMAKAVLAGLITPAAAEALLNALPEEARKKRQLPTTTQPAGAHREPDGNTSVEQLESDAGMGTSPDTKGDKIPPSVDATGTMPPANAKGDRLEVAARKTAAPYAVQRMHDALCPAYADEDVLAAYPALKTTRDAVDSTLIAVQAREKELAGKTKKAAKFAAVAKTADDLLALDPGAFADARAGLRKEFTAAYPTVKIKPGSIMPSQFHRGYLTAGHAAAHATTAATVPPPAHVPEPSQFQRGALTAGHATPSPGDHSPNMPPGAASNGHDYYTPSEQMMARAAQASIHDHIAATFMGTCPMAPDRNAMPSSAGTTMGATNIPEKKVPMSMGGIPTVGKSTDATPVIDPATAEQLLATFTAMITSNTAKATPGNDDGNDDDGDTDGKPFGGNQAPPFGKKKKGKKDKTMTMKEAAEQGAAAAIAAIRDDTTGEAIKTTVSDHITALVEKYDSQIATLTKQVEELGSQPDPAQAPVRGQMSRPADAAPVERRNLIDEVRDRQLAKAAYERSQFEGYVRMLTESPDPKVRSRAEEVLRTMPAP